MELEKNQYIAIYMNSHSYHIVRIPCTRHTNTHRVCVSVFVCVCVCERESE